MTPRLALLSTSPLWLASIAAAGVLHVDDSATGANDGTSWADAFVHLQDALAVAQVGDEIWVAEGTYTPDLGAGQVAGDRGASFGLVHGVAMYGGFDGTELALAQRAGLFSQTVLSGDLNGDDASVGNADNSLRVVEALGLGAGSRFDGFTVAAGFGDSTSLTGAGMYLVGATVDVLNTTVRDNVGVNRGAGVHVSNSGARFVDCAFDSNRIDKPSGGGAVYGAGMSIDGGSPTLTRCTFTGNRSHILSGGGFASGGGLSISSSDAKIVDCVFQDNSAEVVTGGGFGQGGGVYVQSNSDPTFVRCVFQDNFATSQAFGHGGGVYVRFTSNPSFYACAFLGNRAESIGQGGGLYVRTTSSALLASCVVSGNSATSSGGGIYLADDTSSVSVRVSTLAGNTASSQAGGLFVATGASPSVSSSVLWGNTDAGGADESAQVDGPANVNHSCVEGLTMGLGGTGNIGADPLFVDADGVDGIAGTPDDDLRLAAGSPCIDAGANGAVPADAGDLDDDGDTAEPLPLDFGGEPRFHDDPAVADSGAGTAPLVDMGAHESQQPGLSADVTSVSLLTGGVQTFTLSAGPGNAGNFHVLLGSASGTSPGVVIDGFTLPLNVDAYFAFTLNNPGAPPLSGAIGNFDAAGFSSATFTLPLGLPPSAAGLTLHHAYVALELTPTLLGLTLTSNAVPLAIAP